MNAENRCCTAFALLNQIFGVLVICDTICGSFFARCNNSGMSLSTDAISRAICYMSVDIVNANVVACCRRLAKQQNGNYERHQTPGLCVSHATFQPWTITLPPCPSKRFFLLTLFLSLCKASLLPKTTPPPPFCPFPPPLVYPAHAHWPSRKNPCQHLCTHAQPLQSCYPASIHRCTHARLRLPCRHVCGIRHWQNSADAHDSSRCVSRGMVLTLGFHHCAG